MAKIFQIEAYNYLINGDFMCILETYFDSSVLDEDRSQQLNVYNLFRADYPSNTKGGGLCIYYKEFLCVREVKLSDLSQCFIFEVSLRNCKGYIDVVYRSPSQGNAKFEDSLPDFLVEKDKTTAESTHSEGLTFLHTFHQLISKSTHLLPHSNSCIDFIFRDHPNLVRITF